MGLGEPNIDEESCSDLGWRCARATTSSSRFPLFWPEGISLINQTIRLFSLDTQFPRLSDKMKHFGLDDLWVAEALRAMCL